VKKQFVKKIPPLERWVEWDCFHSQRRQAVTQIPGFRLYAICKLCVFRKDNIDGLENGIIQKKDSYFQTVMFI
jgi:hypothetical protein